ncbi:hypothetical protein Tcan_02940 [Toxocara canis]|uniref:Transmembrane protein n=1 Tax=Toxocara canis TaxID=6265 RepID=A0A0B2V445_TOXCA|nr:hypothetical protein Tcan_02940 [Toxocara canis]
MVANVRAQTKREIILEDSAILEEERRTAISFDPRNGSIVAEIGPTSSTLSCLSFPQYDTSTVLDALKNLDNPIEENEFRCAVEKISNDSRFKCYCLLYRNIIPVCTTISIVGLLLLCYAIFRDVLLAVFLLMLWSLFSSAIFFFAVLWRRNMRVRISECMRAVNRSLSAHNLVAGIWDYGRWPHRKVVIILVRYRIRDCTPTVERAFFARWAEQGRGRVEIESAERKDRSTQLLLSESNEYVIALANIILVRYRIRDCTPTVERAFFARWAEQGRGRVEIESAERKDRSTQLLLSESNEYVIALANGLLSLSSFSKDDGRPNHSHTGMCLCRFVINRNFSTVSKRTFHTRISRVFASRSSMASAIHAF